MLDKTNLQTHSQLLLTSKSQFNPDESEIHIFLDHVLGLMDSDFHQITDKGWEILKTQNPSATASLAVSPSVTMQDLQDALEVMALKGKYTTIIICPYQP